MRTFRGFLRLLRILVLGVQSWELAAARLGARGCFVCGEPLDESAYVMARSGAEWLRFCSVGCERDWRTVAS